MTKFDDAYIIERCNGVCFEAIEIIRDLQQQLAELQFQPRLQRVTPEAMAELEARQAKGVLVLSQLGVRILWYGIGNWWVDHPTNRVDRPTAGYFIELACVLEEFR